MSTESAVDAVVFQLENATTYVAIFGPLPTGTHAEQKKALHDSFKKLSMFVHPDKLTTLSPAVQKRGEGAFKMLRDTLERAEKAILDGTYAKSHAPGLKPSTPRATFDLRSPKDTYKVEEHVVREGSFSVLYRGKSIVGGKNVVIKIATTPPNNIWLERELEILTKFYGPTARPRLDKVKYFVPNPIDSFVVPNGRMRFRATVFEEIAGLVSITDLHEAFPSGMDPELSGWVLRRIMAQAQVGAMANVVLGSIVPDHVLVHPKTHDPLHIGWAHWTTERITHVIDRWKDFYPPEVFRKEPVTTAADIYMAGKTMIYLLGGDTKKNTLPKAVPSDLGVVLMKCVQNERSRRFKSGKEALDELTRVVRSLWGKKYRELVLPVR